MTMCNYRNYILIRHQLRKKCKEAYNQNWREKIRSIIESSRDTKIFWNKINMLKGRNTNFTNYLEGQEGNKYYTDKEKCHLMEKTWENMFRITEEEEATFDSRHSEHIEAYTSIYTQRSPYIRSDLGRLDNHKFYTRSISTEEIKKYLNKTKQKAPCASRISKKVIEKNSPQILSLC